MYCQYGFFTTFFMSGVKLSGNFHFLEQPQEFIRQNRTEKNEHEVAGGSQDHTAAPSHTTRKSRQQP